GRQEHCRCAAFGNRLPIAIGHANAAPAIDDQLDGARASEYTHAGVRRDARPEQPSDFTARRLLGVQHAARAMRTFLRQRGLARAIAIEPRAPVDELAHVADTIL